MRRASLLLVMILALWPLLGLRASHSQEDVAAAVAPAERGMPVNTPAPEPESSQRSESVHSPVPAAGGERPGPAGGGERSGPAGGEPPPMRVDTPMGRRLAPAVGDAMADFPGRYSIAVQNLVTGERWVVGEDDRYHPASTIKMPVTLYALHQYRQGKLNWQQGVVYTQADFESPGGGAFETAPFGGVYPVENLVNRALMYSNNVAVNMLGRYLSWNEIRAWSRTIDGELFRREDSSPEVTVRSELGWWLHLHQVSQEDPKAAALVLNPLRKVAYDGRIGAGLPSGVEYLHKFGSYAGYYHDGGIIYAEEPFVLVVMTHGAEEYQADVAIARVTAAIYEAMTMAE